MWRLLRLFLLGNDEIHRDSITISHMDNYGEPKKVLVEEITKIITDDETDLCVILTIAGEVWCFETVEEVIMMLDEVGGLQ